MVRHRILIPAFGGSSPPAPARLSAEPYALPIAEYLTLLCGRSHHRCEAGHGASPALGLNSLAMVRWRQVVMHRLGKVNPYGAAFCSMFTLCLLGIAAAMAF